MGWGQVARFTLDFHVAVVV